MQKNAKEGNALHPLDSNIEGNVWKWCRQSLHLNHVSCRKNLQGKDL